MQKVWIHQYKPVMSLAGSNDIFTHKEHSRGYDQISHELSNIYGLYGWSCNLFGVIVVYSLDLGKLPGCFSFKWPGYEATSNLVCSGLFSCAYCMGTM